MQTKIAMRVQSCTILVLSPTGASEVFHGRIEKSEESVRKRRGRGREEKREERGERRKEKERKREEKMEFEMKN